MLMTDVHFDSEPEAVVIMPLPDGRADVWIRRGIGSAETINDEAEGDEVAAVQYFAQEEAYARLDAGEVSAEAIAQSPDEWYERVASWEPSTPGGSAPAESEEMSAMRKQVESLAEKVGELTDQNATLTECLLEMSEEIYG